MKRPLILKKFELLMTSKQIAEVKKMYAPNAGSYIAAFEPKPCLGILRVHIISKEFGDKLAKQIATELKRSGQ